MLTSCYSLFSPPKEEGGHIKARYRGMLMNFEDYYALGEQIHNSLLDVHILKDEMKQLDKMLDDIQQKLDSAIDLKTIRQHNM